MGRVAVQKLPKSIYPPAVFPLLLDDVGGSDEKHSNRHSFQHEKGNTGLHPKMAIRA